MDGNGFLILLEQSLNKKPMQRVVAPCSSAPNHCLCVCVLHACTSFGIVELSLRLHSNAYGYESCFVSMPTFPAQKNFSSFTICALKHTIQAQLPPPSLPFLLSFSTTLSQYPPKKSCICSSEDKEIMRIAAVSFLSRSFLSSLSFYLFTPHFFLGGVKLYRNKTRLSVLFPYLSLFTLNFLFFVCIAHSEWSIQT